MYHFIGIKGSGMASLAGILADLNETVSGSDIDKFIFTQEALEKRQIPIYSFNKDNIKDGMTVIYGNSFDYNHEEVKAAMDNPTVTTFRYTAFLGHLMERFKSVSIAGTHGKTTTTGLVSTVLATNKDTAYLIGDGTGHATENSEYFVVESCEYQDNYLNYFPKYAVITNIELDHVDYFKSMEQYLESFERFANQVQELVVLCGDDPYVKNLKVKTNKLYYGINDDNDVKAVNIIEDENGVSFDCYIKNEFYHHFTLHLYGRHMLLNSLAAIALGYQEKIDPHLIEDSLKHFQGVKRRFTIKEELGSVFVDDYAHHPTAIKLMIQTVRQKYPNKKVVAVFKPDRYSRIFRFGEEIAYALKDADYGYLCHFPETSAKEEGIDIDISYVQGFNPELVIINEDLEAAKQISKHHPCVYLFMSSKDIYKFEDILINYLKEVA